MPLAKRTVDPVRLSRAPVDKENQFDLGIVSNNSLVAVLLQLSNLAKEADCLFCELTDELVLTVQRADRLKNRVDIIDKNVSGLNAKTVKVPEGDLESYAKILDHYHNNNNYSGGFFSSDSRPDSIKVLHESAEDNPVKIIRQCNANRTDGKRGSMLFTLTPFFQDDVYVEPEVELELKPLPVPETDRNSRDVPDATKSRPQSLPPFREIEPPVQPDRSRFPTPEDKVREMSRSQPVALVPIDITGSGFTRMCEYRESIRSTSREYLEDDGNKSLRKNKRRQTVSGIPGIVISEPATTHSMYNMNHLMEQSRSASRDRSERPKSAALEYYAPRLARSMERVTANVSQRKKKEKSKKDKCDPDESNLARSCSLRRSLKSLFKDKRSKSIDLWAEGRPSSPGPPVVDLNVPLQRSRSLPRSLKSVMRSSSSASKFSANRCASTEGRLDSRSGDELDGTNSTLTRSNTLLTRGRKANKRTKIPRSLSHNTNLSCSTFVDKPERPKSMEFGTSSNSRQPIPVSTPSVTSTDSIMTTSTQESRASEGKLVHVNIPDKPWTKPFARVKLRVNGKQNVLGKDERQSSSGHWSASSSSARHSLDSDVRSASSPERLSQCDKDSAVSMNIHRSDRNRSQVHEGSPNYIGDGDSSTLNGSSSGNESVIDVKNNTTKISTSEWLKSAKIRKGKGISRTGTIRSTISESSNEDAMITEGSRLTTKNLKVHDHVHQPLEKGMNLLGDDESSIYSIDQDGFYTSMHKDCGMHKATERILEEEEETISSSTVSDDTATNSPKVKIHSNISKKFSSFLSRKGTVKRKDKKNPPPPPLRVSTVSDKNNLDTERTEEEDKFPAEPTELEKLAQLAKRMAASKEHESRNMANRVERSPSTESDSDSIYARVKLKSNISPSAIPSLCSVTPLQSDDEDADMLGFSSAWKPPFVTPTAADYMRYTSTLKSAKSAPGPLNESINMDSLDSTGLLSTSPDISSLEADESLLHMSKSSTWPRSPSQKEMAAKPKPKTPLLSPPDCLTIKPPKFSLFYADDNIHFVDHRHTLPEAKTPDSILDNRGFQSPTNNTFKAPQETSTPIQVQSDEPVFFATPSVNSILSMDASNLDKSQTTFSETPNGSANWTSTWPRRKAGTFISGASAVSKDDSTIATSSRAPMKVGAIRRSSTTNTFPRKGDRAHFISSAFSRKIATPKTLPVTQVFSQQDPQPAQAKLVISSPVANRACFVENPYKRSVCSPVTADDLLKFWNYSSADKWYNTLPRKGHHDVKQSLSFNNADDLSELLKKQDSTEPSINQVPKSLTMFDFTTPSVLEEDPATSTRVPSKPLFPSIIAMKHSLNFPNPERKGKTNSYGRTWYDGVDAPSTVVVMNPDGTKGPPSSKSSFHAFLREHSGSSLGVPTLGCRRDSSASSISTNSSSSGRKSVTFAMVHKTSSSSLSRTSLDCTSITSSQISGDMPSSSDTKSLYSIQSEDDIQVTPQKPDPLHLPSGKHTEPSSLKRCSCSGSGDLKPHTLETIIASDSETLMNPDQSFDEGGAPTDDKTLTKPGQPSEPSAKRQKVTSVQQRANSIHRHRLSPRSKMKHAAPITTSFVGPSFKIDPPIDKLITEEGKEIKPMPLITTSFIGPSFSFESTKASNTSNTTIAATSDYDVPKVVSPASCGPARISFTHSRPIGPPPPPPVSKGASATNSSEKSLKELPTFQIAKSQPKAGLFQGCKSPFSKFSTLSLVPKNPKTKGDDRSVKSNIVAVKTNNTGSLPRQSSSSAQLSSFSAVSNDHNGQPGVSPSSANQESSSTDSLLSPKSATLPLKTSSVVSHSQSMKPNPSVCTASKTISVPSSSNCSSQSVVTSSSTSSSQPAPPKFTLPKLRPWNPSNLANSRTTTLLSKLTSGALSANRKNANAGSSSSGANSDCTANGASPGSPENASSDLTYVVGAGGTSRRDRASSSPPEGALPSGPQDDNPNKVCGNTPPSQAGSASVSSYRPSFNRSKSLNQSLRDLSKQEDEPTLANQLQPKTSNKNRSTSSLHQWSIADGSLDESSLSLACSATNLAGRSISSNNLNTSCLSLAKSTDSLASNSSTAEKARAAKIAFLNSGDSTSSPRGSIDDRFAKHSLGKKLSASRTSLASLSEHQTESSVNNSSNTRIARTISSSSSTSSSSVGEKNNNNREGKSSPKSSPVQGKYVNSVLDQLQRKEIDATVTKASHTEGSTSPK